MQTKNNILFVILVFIGALSRLIPHGWNFTAIGAVALVAGFLILNKALAVATPLLALLISDLVIGFHSTMIYVYGAYALIVGLGILFKYQKQFKNIILTSVTGSLLFFMITNFGVWAEGIIYAKNFSGLMESFVMGIPFYRNQFLSDLILTPIIYYSLFYSSVHLMNFRSLSKRKSI